MLRGSCILSIDLLLNFGGRILEGRRNAKIRDVISPVSLSRSVDVNANSLYNPLLTCVSFGTGGLGE